MSRGHPPVRSPTAQSPPRPGTDTGTRAVPAGRRGYQGPLEVVTPSVSPAPALSGWTEAPREEQEERVLGFTSHLLRSASDSRAQQGVAYI